MENDPPPDPPRLPDDFWTRRRWLARFSFSFLIIGVYLAYTAWNGSQTHVLSRGRAILYCVAAALSFVMFILGIRERHRRGD